MTNEFHPYRLTLNVARCKNYIYKNNKFISVLKLKFDFVFLINKQQESPLRRKLDIFTQSVTHSINESVIVHKIKNVQYLSSLIDNTCTLKVFVFIS